MIFMFASTNLVIELGIVLIVLMGWQFAVSEFAGGIIMIVLLAAAGSLWLRGRVVVAARERASQQAGTGQEHVHGPRGGHEGHDAHDAHEGHEGHGPADSASTPLRDRLRSKAGWSEAASYMIADLRMLLRELAVGYIVAGLLAVLVPVSAWHALFVTGHGWWTSVENALIGPLVAIISFVCSIGNVPLAAALWKGGISFGGVIAFLFADLITFPLLLIYRRFYGTRMMLRMLVVFWAVMSAAGLVTEVIFRAAGIVPAVRPTAIAPARFAWNYTTYLNIIFLAVFAVLYWLYRNRERFSGETGSAEDPVCGMRVDRANAPAAAELNGHRVYFCSDRCAARFAAATADDAHPDAEGRQMTSSGA
jgi:hypothetical protein